MFIVQLLYISVKKPISHQTRARSYGHRYSYNVTFSLTKDIESTKMKHLRTNEFFLLVPYNKLGMVHWIYAGVTL